MIVVIVVSFICSRHVGNSENLGRRHNRKLLIIEKSASADSEYDRVVRRSMTYERPSMHEIRDVDEYKVMRRASRVLQYVVYQNSGSVRGTAVSRAIESTLHRLATNSFSSKHRCCACCKYWLCKNCGMTQNCGGWIKTLKFGCLHCKCMTLFVCFDLDALALTLLTTNCTPCLLTPYRL